MVQTEARTQAVSNVFIESSSDAKLLLIILIVSKNRISFKVFAEGSPQKQYDVKTVEGANLLDTLNDMSIEDLSVFGICEK